jgi:hypothetical protein
MLYGMTWCGIAFMKLEQKSWTVVVLTAFSLSILSESFSGLSWSTLEIYPKPLLNYSPCLGKVTQHPLCLLCCPFTAFLALPQHLWRESASGVSRSHVTSVKPGPQGISLLFSNRWDWTWVLSEACLLSFICSANRTPTLSFSVIKQKVLMCFWICILGAQNTHYRELGKAPNLFRVRRTRSKVADITSWWVGLGRGPECCITSWTESSGGFSLHHCGCHLPLHAAWVPAIGSSSHRC